MNRTRVHIALTLIEEKKKSTLIHLKLVKGREKVKSFWSLPMFICLCICDLWNVH